MNEGGCEKAEEDCVCVEGGRGGGGGMGGRKVGRGAA